MPSEKNCLRVEEATPPKKDIKKGKGRGLPGIVIHPLKIVPPLRRPDPSPCMDAPTNLLSPASTLRTFGVNSPASTAPVLTPSISYGAPNMQDQAYMKVKEENAQSHYTVLPKTESGIPAWAEVCTGYDFNHGEGMGGVFYTLI